MDDIVEQTATLDALTGKQREVLRFVSEGMTSKEIARKLGISESAVNQRIETVRQRLGGMSRAQIGRLFRRTSTLVMTIPTSNSLTGNPIQLLAEREGEQHLQPEGVVVLEALGAETDHGGLQPSNLSPPASDRVNHTLFRLGVIVWIAVGIAALAVLILTATHAISELFAQSH